MTAEIDFVQLRTVRRLATLSLASAALSVLAFAVAELFLWKRPTLFAYENVMDTGASLMGVSAILGIAGFIRAGDSGVHRPAPVKWTFGLAVIFLVLLIALLVSILRMPPIT